MIDIDKRGKVSAVYNVFAFAMTIPLFFILPRLKESLHPGGQGVEGNPGLNPKDLDANMRIVFYPAIIGWTLLGTWITTLRIRYRIYQEKNVNMNKLNISYSPYYHSFLFFPPRRKSGSRWYYTAERNLPILCVAMVKYMLW